ncbi:MAG TPA: hypothetical protein PLL77_08060 [Pyrinomonadaceae bacterium]|nr:hypothetical protein [Pyrinomonadaceae bacterium]
MIFAATSCKKRAPGTTNAKVDPQLIMFGGWQADSKGIFLAKNDTANEGEKVYLALNKPNAEPVEASDAPKMEVDFGKKLYLAGGNNISRYAQVVTDKDEAGKITKAHVAVVYTKANMGKDSRYDLEPVEHSLHGWSSNNVYVVMSREDKKVFVINAHSSGIGEVKLKQINSFDHIALAADKNGFYVVGRSDTSAFVIEFVDFNNVIHKQEQSKIVLNIPKATAGRAAYRGVLSPDQKVLAVLSNSHPNADVNVFEADAENKLMLYDVASGQMTRECKLPNGDADLRNMLFVKGPWWRGDNRALAFDLRLTPDKKTFYSIDLSTGEITNWFTSEKQPQPAA